MISLLAMRAIGAGVLLASLIAGYLGWHHHVYSQGVAAEKLLWDADTSRRQAAEVAAVAKRNAENNAAANLARENNRVITRNYDEQIAALRTRVNAAPRLRVGPAFCGRSADKTSARSASSSNAADSGTRVLSAEVDADIRKLILEVETALATARAAQTFIRENGMAP